MKIEAGDIVDYHSVIDGPITSGGHRVDSILRAPNAYGCDVAWISGKRGCVALSALTLTPEAMGRCPMATIDRTPEGRDCAYSDAEIADDLLDRGRGERDYDYM